MTVSHASDLIGSLIHHQKYPPNSKNVEVGLISPFPSEFMLSGNSLLHYDVTKTCLLGLTVDNRLTWKEQCQI